MDTASSIPPAFDRTREDSSNIIALEHVNVQIADQQLATAFYVTGLLLTRDPYMMVGLDNMWINAGRTQFHLPTSVTHPQRVRGAIGLVVPEPDALEQALKRVAPKLEGTKFGMHRTVDNFEATCPWGNRFRIHAPDPHRWGQTGLGVAYIDFDVPAGTARAIANFYLAQLDTPVDMSLQDNGLCAASVRIGADQRLNYVETHDAIPAYDGHHIQIYMADFSGPHWRLCELGLVSRETDAHEWRFIDIIDPDTGAVAYQLEHEVRSMRHPLFGRSLVNRNPVQSNRNYLKGKDAFRGAY
ncbi:MAG: hypothetical protein ABIS68_00355 [Casimicrobiaceae bacterium]